MKFQEKLYKLKKNRTVSKTLLTQLQTSSFFQKLFLKDFKTSFVLSPITLKKTTIAQKERIIAQLQPQDQLYHSVLADYLIQSYTHPRLYSFFKKKSSYIALRHLTNYIRNNNSQKGIYIYKFDIKEYGDSIPLHSKSKLWKYIIDHTSKELMLKIQRCLRMETTDGFCFYKGSFFGSPLTPAINNLYAKDVDTICEKADFAIRYCDDILVASTKKEVIIQIQKKVLDKLQELELSIKTEKEKWIHLTKSGFSDSGFVGSEYIDHLGFRVFADGTIGLPRKKIRLLYTELREVLLQSRKLYKKASFEEELSFYITVVNAYLTTPQIAHKYAQTLLSQITNRKQLQQVDRTIAQYISRTLTKSDTQIPQIVFYNKGLQSLVKLRNIQ